MPFSLKKTFLDSILNKLAYIGSLGNWKTIEKRVIADKTFLLAFFILFYKVWLELKNWNYGLSDIIQ